MLSKWQFRLLNVLAVAALALVVANGVLFHQNRGEQSAFNQRQQFIQQTVPLEGLYREIVKALVDLAVKSDDRAVLDMLGSQGISITVNTPSAAPAAADSAPRKVGK